jgi:GNAT superfamily N-acetyltransferase
VVPAIRQLAREEASGHLPALTGLLLDAVDSGASIGFLAPLSAEEGRSYWIGTIAALGDRHLLYGAFDDSGLAGSVQLIRSARASSLHRAEVAKLLVHRRAQRRGLGEALMRRVEAQAQALGLGLLTLDTRTGDDAERLYLRLGWIRFGIVPRYVRSSAGPMTDTSFHYKQIG